MFSTLSKVGGFQHLSLGQSRETSCRQQQWCHLYRSRSTGIQTEKNCRIEWKKKQKTKKNKNKNKKNTINFRLTCPDLALGQISWNFREGFRNGRSYEGRYLDICVILRKKNWISIFGYPLLSGYALWPNFSKAVWRNLPLVSCSEMTEGNPLQKKNI